MHQECEHCGLDDRPVHEVRIGKRTVIVCDYCEDEINGHIW